MAPSESSAISYPAHNRQRTLNPNQMKNCLRKFNADGVWFYAMFAPQASYLGCRLTKTSGPSHYYPEKGIVGSDKRGSGRMVGNSEVMAEVALGPDYAVIGKVNLMERESRVFRVLGSIRTTLGLSAGVQEGFSGKATG